MSATTGLLGRRRRVLYTANGRRRRNVDEVMPLGSKTDRTHHGDDRVFTRRPERRHSSGGDVDGGFGVGGVDASMPYRGYCASAFARLQRRA